MNTDFISANTVQQVSDNFYYTIPWNDVTSSTSNDAYAVSSDTLYTIPGLWMERFRSKTNQIWMTDYQIPLLSETIVGIELRVNIKRSARIQDLTIQLTLNGNLIGLNYGVDMTTQYAYQHNLPVIGDYNVYGGPTDMWGTTLTTTDITDPTFGAVVAFQSNETLPHRDLAYINQLALRIHFG